MKPGLNMLIAKKTAGQLFDRVAINPRVPHVSANDGEKPEI